VQFDPVGTARFSSACDIAKSLLVARGISYGVVASPDSLTSIRVGRNSLSIGGAEDASAKQLKSYKEEVGKALGTHLLAAGYPASADPVAIDYSVLLLVLFGFVVAATALYGPQAAALVEMFPTRIRYTAMSLPYHIGTGWVGGFLPVTSFAIVALTGDIYAGLWYAVAFTALSALVTLLFLKETRGKPLEDV
jgi:hypothetical protein